MYFFLDYRAKVLNESMKRQEAKLNAFKKSINKSIEDTAFQDETAVKAKKVARSLGKNLRHHDHDTKSLDLLIKNNEYGSGFGLFKSFFCFWSTEYKIRERTGKHLTKAESKLSELADLSRQFSASKRK